MFEDACNTWMDRALKAEAALAAPQPQAGASEPVARANAACGAGSNPPELLQRAESYLNRNDADGRGSALLIMELADCLRAALYATPSPTEAGRTECDCTDECLHKPDCVFERDPQESAPK